MTEQELGKAKDEDLKGSLAAIRRAAQQARAQAMRTGTAIIVARNRQWVRVTAEELRDEEVR